MFQAPEPISISTTMCRRPHSVLYKDFLQSQDEAVALSQLKKWIFTYVLHKKTLKPDHLLFSFKEHVAALQGGDIHAEPAVVLYLSIVDMHADTTEAMSEVAAMLYKEYIVTTGAQYL